MCIISQLQEIGNAKRQSERLAELLLNKNMGEAKKLINKASPEAQKLVDTFIERELNEANKTLRDKAESELEQWKAIDGKNFSSSYMEFESRIGEIEGQL